jgi:hypothetical protein
MRADNSLPLQTGDTPDWVSDWLSRRRKPDAPANINPNAPMAAMSDQPKDMSAVTLAPPEVLEDPKTIARRAAAAEKRATDTDQALMDAVVALEGWIGDQLRLGLAPFIDDVTVRCRRIAARLVDGKAATLAGRLDELPARLLSLPIGDRVRGAVIELGKLVLLVRAFRAQPKDAAIRRSIGTTENRDSLLENPETLRITSVWEVLGEKIETRRDGLVSQTSWLLNLGQTGARFAVLLDYYPASAGKRSSAFTIGEQFEGELIFYPAPTPSRALLLSRTSLGDSCQDWPTPATGTIASWIGDQLHQEPWLLEVPVLLPQGQLLVDDQGAPWWKSGDGRDLLRIQNPVSGLVLGTSLKCAAAVWSTGGLRLLAAQTKWGRIHCVS